MTNMTHGRSNAYEPNRADPFSLDPQPEAFTVDLVEHYSALPTGVMEITSESVIPVRGETLSLYDEEPRVLVVRHAGAAGLVELRGTALDLENAEVYLSHFGRHTRGAHVREYGRLGAAIIEACVAFQADMQQTLASESIEDDHVLIGKPARRCDFERGITRIEVELGALSPSRLISAEREMRDWNAWLAVKATSQAAPTTRRAYGYRDTDYFFMKICAAFPGKVR